MPRATTMTIAAFAAVAACAIAARAAAQVVTSAGGEVISAAQKHLIDNLITLDSIQASTAKLAVTKTQNATVRDFATTLATDHAAHATGLQALAARPSVGREADGANKTAGEFASRYTALEGMPAGPEFDRAFLQATVANHQAEIAAINAGKMDAKDEELKKGSGPDVRRPPEPRRQGERDRQDARQDRHRSGGKAAALRRGRLPAPSF